MLQLQSPNNAWAESVFIFSKRCCPKHMKPLLQPPTPPLVSVPLLLLAWTGCSVSTMEKGSTGGLSRKHFCFSSGCCCCCAGKGPRGPLTTVPLLLLLLLCGRLSAWSQSLVASLIMRIMHESRVLNFNCLNNKLQQRWVRQAFSMWPTNTLEEIFYLHLTAPREGCILTRVPWERNFPAQHETHDTTSARSLSVVAMHARSLSRSPTLCASLSPLHLSLSLWLSWAFTPLSICSNLCARLTWVQLFVIVAASLCVCVRVC